MACPWAIPMFAIKSAAPSVVLARKHTLSRFGTGKGLIDLVVPINHDEARHPKTAHLMPVLHTCWSSEPWKLIVFSSCLTSASKLVSSLRAGDTSVEGAGALTALNARITMLEQDMQVERAARAKEREVLQKRLTYETGRHLTYKKAYHQCQGGIATSQGKSTPFGEEVGVPGNRTC